MSEIKDNSLTVDGEKVVSDSDTNNDNSDEKNAEISNKESLFATTNQNKIKYVANEFSIQMESDALESNLLTTISETKVSMSVDSDDDAAEVSKPVNTIKSIEDSDSGEEEEEENNLERSKLSKKNRKLIISDSEKEEEDEEEHGGDDNAVANIHRRKTIPTNMISKIINSESDSDNDANKKLKPHLSPTEIINEFPKSSPKNEKNYALLSDSDDENSQSNKKPKTKNKISMLIDSDSESDSVAENTLSGTNKGNETDLSVGFESNDDDEIAENTANKQKRSKKQNKPVRVSAKKAMEDMKAVMSETQRLHREATITIPYHKPKQRTLQEFLQRRTIIKPNLHGDGSPAAAILKSKNLKMTAEELEEYAQLMEERAKEATEFFKSESESETESESESEEEKEKEKEVIEQEVKNMSDEEEMILYDNPGVLDVNLPTESQQEIQLETQLITDSEINTTTNEPTTCMEQSNDLNNEEPFMENATTLTTADIRRIKTEVADSEMEIYDDMETNEDLNTEETTDDMNNEDGTTSVPTNMALENLLDKENIDKPNTTDVVDSEIKSNATDDNDNVENTENSLLATQAVVTEVLELPKLNMNELRITPDKAEALAKKKLESTEKLKKLLEEKLMHESPTLKGDPNMLIDLETGDLVAKKPSGVDNLFKRLLLTRKAPKTKENETVDILSVENGKLEVSKVQIKLHENENPIAEQKPRAAYFKLKENLKSIIMKKRLEEIKKKKEEEMEYNRCLNEDDSDDEFEYEPENKPKKKDKKLDVIEVDEDENINEFVDLDADEDNDDNDDDDDDVQLVKEAEEENNEDLVSENGKKIDENENGSEDDSDDEDESESENDDGNSNKATQKRKNRIIKAFQDDSDDELDLLKTPTQQSLSTSLLNVTTVNLFEDEPNKDNSAVEQELLGLCSGNFGETQVQTAPNTNLISQIPITQYKSEQDFDKELMEMCSGPFNESIKTQTLEQTIQTVAHESLLATAVETEELPTLPVMKKPFKILSSEEEAEVEEIKTGNVPSVKERKKKLVKKLKKKKPKLGFSDDEESDEDFSNPEEVKNDEEEIIENDDEEDIEAPETYVEYDSEENEIVVQMTKNEVVKQAHGFFENEAVLSDEEWGSADEDEKNMDTYDIELGDEDEFDRDKIQTELGQIHARKMMDQDIKEVRRLQEIFFEDEENDGVGRQRQFKWKNAEIGFSLDDKNNNGENDENAAIDSGDEESEHLWRKKRYEREQFLKERGLKESSQNLTNETTELSNSTNNAFIIAKSNISTIAKKLNIITPKSATNVKELKKQSPFLISKTVNAAKTARGSFLVRDKDTLTKLAADLTKGTAGGASTSGLNDPHNTAGTVIVKSIKPQNFVFATLTEEEVNLKRKTEDLLNSSGENGGINYMKKPKIEPRRDKCFIDQLL